MLLPRAGAGSRHPVHSGFSHPPGEPPQVLLPQLWNFTKCEWEELNKMLNISYGILRNVSSSRALEKRLGRLWL